MAWWVVWLPFAAGCAVWTCEENEDSSLCATWTGDRVAVNSLGCASYNQQCTFSLLLEAITNSTAGSYPCEDVASPTSPTKYMPFAGCGKREPEQRRLKQGSFPQQCAKEGLTDPACELNDGSYIPCRCSLSGQLYCQPNPSDAPFDEFWTACDDQDGVVTQDFFSYYEVLSLYYAESIQPPSCISAKIYEFKKLSTLAPAPSSSFLLLLSYYLVI